MNLLEYYKCNPYCKKYFNNNFLINHLNLNSLEVFYYNLSLILPLQAYLLQVNKK